MNPAQPIYRPDIDGLRAISILLVLFYHGFPHAVPGGFIGVDVFFVISGYLITGQIYGQAKSNAFSFVGFYARRIRRIFPPLIAVLIFVAIYGYLKLNLNDFTALLKHISAGVAFISNFIFWHETGYFDQQAEFKPLLHLWSLAIEEQFYVFWPMLVVALTAFSRRCSNALNWGLLSICVASLAITAYLAEHDSVAAFYSPASRFWELGLGGILAVLQLNGFAFNFDENRFSKNIAAAIAVVCLVACAFLLSSTSYLLALKTALPALSALTIIAVGPDTAINRRLLASKPMVQLGLISYALYLWHWPLLSFTRIENRGLVSSTTTWLLLGVSVVLAALTRVALEKPIRSSSMRHATPWLSAIWVCIGIAGIVGYRTDIFRSQRMLQQAQIQAQISTAWREYNGDGIPISDCAEFIAPDTPAYRNCRVLGSSTAKRTVAVWGDSMAVAWMPPFFTLARERGWRVIQLTHTGCPPIIGVFRTDRTDLECTNPTLPAQILEVVQRAKPDVVFLIARWNLYYLGHIRNDVLVEPTFITDGAKKASAEYAKKTFGRYFPETIKRLSAISQVVIFRDTPLLKVPVDVGMTTRPNTFEPSLSETKRFEAEIDQIINAVVTRTPNAVIFDPTARLCNTTKCSAYLDGLPAYFDEVHLTAHAALQFVPDIELLGYPQ